MIKLIRTVIAYFQEWGNGPTCISPELLAGRPTPTYNVVNKPRFVGEQPRTVAQAEAWGYSLEHIASVESGNLVYKFNELPYRLELRPENGGWLTKI